MILFSFIVIFLDTEGTLYFYLSYFILILIFSRPQRITEIAQRYGLNGDEVLENILLARAYTHEQQMDIITAAAAKIVEDESPYHLLVCFIINNDNTDCRLDYCIIPSGLQWKRRIIRKTAEAWKTLKCVKEM